MYLIFNGRELSLHRNGEKIKSWPAMSGHPEYQCDNYQDVFNKGPLPEGEWLVKQSNIQNYSNYSFIQKTIHSTIGNWKGGSASWGKDRIWIESTNRTNTKNRNGFSIHGGKEFGSAGCIDLANSMDDFLNEFRSYGKDIIIKVKYPKNSCW